LKHQKRARKRQHPDMATAMDLVDTRTKFTSKKFA